MTSFRKAKISRDHSLTLYFYTPLHRSEILEDGLYGISLKADSDLMTDETDQGQGGEMSHSLILSSQSTTLQTGMKQALVPWFHY